MTRAAYILFYQSHGGLEKVPAIDYSEQKLENCHTHTAHNLDDTGYEHSEFNHCQIDFFYQLRT